MLSRCRHLEASEWVLSPGFARNGAGLARIGPSAHAFVENGAGSDRRLVPEATECATHSRTSSVASACAAVSTSPNSTSMAASSAADGIVHREGPSSRTRKSSQVSPGYRSQCRLRTGAASAKCRAGTGARVSPSYRNLTNVYGQWRSWSGRRDSNPRPSAWEASGLGGRSGAELGQERGDLGRCDREGGFGACPTTRPGW